jgi:hypothetical protein
MLPSNRRRTTQVATQRQIDSARRNGAKSNGPITPEGKAKSSLNALKHGLAADPEIILEHENNDNYDRLLEGYVHAYKPASGDEYDLVCQIVSASWRLRRIGRMEANLIEDQMASCARILAIGDETAPDEVLEAKAFRNLTYPGRSIDLVIRYTTMARRCYDTAVKTLRDLQRERRKSEKQNEPDFAKVPAKSAPRGTSHVANSLEEVPRSKTVVVFPTPSSETEPIDSAINHAPQTGFQNDPPKEGSKTTPMLR